MVLATLINLLDNDDGISEPQKRPAQQTALRFGPQTAADRQLQRYAM